jgi:5,10-methylenetetrahydromethanopterin reductase
MFPGTSAGALVDAIVAAEDLGLDEVWIADEGVARDPIVLLAAASVRTSRIRLATGIISPILRHPGSIASSIATLDELSSGRAILGLGVGGHLALAPFGLGADRPVGRLGDAIRIVRAVHSGIGADGYLPPPHAAPPRSIPIWIGARGPQLVRLAARAADGLFLSGCTPDELDAIVANAADVEPVDLAIYQTAIEHPEQPNESSWDAVADALIAATSAYAPAAVGVNLVQLATEGVDPLPLVERAADLLSGV